MGKKLLIVESPAKAKTIGKYLGGEYTVKSSVGHIRDLPKENGAIRIESMDEGKWRFVPKYEISSGKEKVVGELKSAVKNSDEIYLASDPDREGEAIAWHLREVLEDVAGGKPFHRVTYNEITKSAVLKAVAEPREIDMPLVDAQQSRRILDRLVGYKVSPLLWKNIQCANNRSLSAGRVQSVALRLLVERQREIDAFVPEVYFLLGVEAKKRTDPVSFVAKLARLDGAKPEVRDRQSADNVLLDLAGAELEVSDIKLQPKVRHALPPFTTSTLQQAASSVLGFSPGKTMKSAQALYERGLITYMRTDSVNISEQARAAAKEFIVKYCGEEYYPAKPNFFKSKEDAQGAHEAIRPTDVGLSPKFAENQLDAADLKLYDLIWRRFLASQMADARTVVKTVSLKACKAALAHSYVFTASATDIEFEGFLKIMKLSLKKKTKDGEDDEDTDEVAALPQLTVGERLDAVRWIADEKKTKGPSHYSEASLIKALEENGVGRPSTYAATIETLKAREYAKSVKKKLVPLERGILVCDWLVAKLESLFSVGYTAQMESELDKVASGGEPMDAMLSDFYRNFLKAVEDAMPPPPERGKLEGVLSLLDEVKEWKEAKTVGKRVYDDCAFVDSVRRQFNEGKVISDRQLSCLVKVAVMYKSQIADCEARLKDMGLLGSVSARAESADATLVKWCFSVVDRIDGILENPFIKSLHDQFDRGRALSIKQFAVLAKAVGENAVVLPDCDEIRSRLADFVPGGFSSDEDSDPAIPELIKLLDSVSEWRPVVKKGRKVYDDRSFVKSLAEQYSRRRSLSPRQVMALRRIVATYRDSIPGFTEAAQRLGIEIPATPRGKKAKAGDDTPTKP